MKLKKFLCVLTLVSGIALLNISDPMLLEAGKALVIISILGFGALASYHLSEFHESEEFTEFKQESTKQRELEYQDRKVA